MTGASLIPVFIVIIVVLRIKKLINRYKISGTISPQSAKTLKELNIRRSLVLRKLLRRNVIIESAPGKFYLQENNLIEYLKNRRRRMKTVVIILMIIMILLILTDIFITHF
jgi:hypothetical protein